MSQSQTANKINAQFNRAYISRQDFSEAYSYLHQLKRIRREPTRRALLLAAVIAYCRPFSNNERTPQSLAVPSLPINPKNVLSLQEFELHTKLMKLRNTALAHSDYNQKPITRIVGNVHGVATQSRPFDLLWVGIEVVLFLQLCQKFEWLCTEKIHELNRALQAAETTGN